MDIETEANNGFSVSESLIEFELESGQIEERSFNITNNMEDSLEWHLSIRNQIEESDAMGFDSPFQNEASSPNFITQEIDQFLKKAGDDEQISVIVEFETDDLTEAGGVIAKTKARQQHFSEIRDDIISRVDSGNLGNIKRFQFMPLVALQVNREGLEELLNHPQIKRVVEDRIDDIELEVSVPLIGAQSVWDMGYSGQGQAVVILDTGVDGDHPFFADRIVDEYCYSSINSSRNIESLCPDGSVEQSGSGAAEACEICGHGTHVTGIVAGDNQDFSGVAPDANIIPMQIFSEFNDDDDCNGNAPCVRTFLSDQISALEKVYEISDSLEIASVNMSLGGGEHSNYCYNDLRSPIIDQLAKRNIATVTSSGNSNFSNSVSAPGCIPSIVSVGATTTGSNGGARDEIASFSNGSRLVDLLAPGVAINSSQLNGLFGQSSGTSMASPHVAGAWAVYKSQSPEATVNEVLNNMQMSGRKILDDRNSIVFNRLQIDEALDTDYWLVSDKFFGSLASGESEEVNLTLDTADLEPGTYRAELAITASEQDITMSSISVVLEVIPGGEVEIVWPGDASNDGEVTAADVLPVGLCYSREHEGELNPGSYWKGYYRQVWNETEPFCLFADSNGDGQVDESDVEVIDYNFGRLTDSEGSNSSGQKENISGEITLEWESIAEAEDEIVVRLNSDQPIYGLSYTINYQFPEERPRFWDYIEADLQSGTLDPEAITFQKHQETGWQLHMAAVGTDHQTGTQSGELMRIPVTMPDDFEGEVIMEIENLMAINTNGDEIQLEAGRLEQLILPEVSETILEQNFPNPFNSETVIRFGLPETQQVVLEIYNVMGRQVKKLVDEQRSAGWHTVRFEVNDLASGLYFYRLRTNNFAETKKMLYVK